MTSVILGLTTAFGWGTASLLARYTSRSLGATSAALYSQATGFVMILLYILITGDFANRMDLPWYWWGLGLLAAGVHTFSLVMIYRAFEVGVLSIVTPIGASSAAITVVLSAISGEQITLLNGLGMAAAIVGVVLAVRRPPTGDSKKKVEIRAEQGVIFALIAALGFGVWFWLLGFHISPRFGPTVPVLLVRISAVIWLSLFFVSTGDNFQLRRPNRRDWILIVSQTALATTAFVLNNIAYTYGNVSTQSVFASLNSAVAVMWGGFLLRERLAWSQWLGIGLALVGVVLLSAQI